MEKPCTITHEPFLGTLLRVKPPFAENLFDCIDEYGGIPDNIDRLEFFISEYPDSSFVPKRSIDAIVAAGLGLYDLHRLKWKFHDLLRDLTFGEYSPYNCFTTYNKPEQDTICKEKATSSIGNIYECGVCTVSDIGKLLSVIYNKIKNDHLLTRFFHKYLDVFTRKLIAFLYDEVGPTIGSIRNGIAFLYSFLVEKYKLKDHPEKLKQLEDVFDKFEDKINKLDEKFESALKELQSIFHRDKDYTNLFRLLTTYLDEIDDMLYELAGDIGGELVLRGEVDNYVDQILNIIKSASNTEKNEI